MISEAIATGANSFLQTEFMYMAVFVVVFSITLIVVLGSHDGTLALKATLFLHSPSVVFRARRRRAAQVRTRHAPPVAVGG